MVKLRLLGPTEVVGPDESDVPGVVTRRKRLALLSYLALQAPGTFRRRESLVGLLWPDSDESKARASLSVTLHHLRSLLGEGFVVRRGSEEVGIDPEMLWVDARAFVQAVDDGNLRDAAELYRGHLLDGFHVSGTSAFTTWLEGERRRLGVLAVNTLTTLAESTLHSDPHDSSRWARRAASLAPYDEQAHACLVRALAESAHHAEALQVLDGFRQRLSTDLDLEPSKRMRALEQRLRSAHDGPGHERSAPAVGEDAGGDARGGEPARPGTVGPAHPSGSSLAKSAPAAAMSSAPPPKPSGSRARTTAAAAALVVATALVTSWVAPRGTRPPEPRRVSVSLPEGAMVGAVTPRLLDDGSGVVYAGPGEGGGGQRLWHYRWSSIHPIPARSIPGSDGVRSFDASPDAGEVALIVADSIRVQSLRTFVSRLLVPGGVHCCVRWHDDGWVYFTNLDAGLSRVPEDGGEVEVLSVADVGGTTSMHAWPAPVPGGRYLVFELSALFGLDSRIGLLDTATGKAVAIADGRYPTVSAGVVFFTSRDGIELYMAELDRAALQDIATIVDDMSLQAEPQWGGSYDVSSDGDLIYTRGPGPRQHAVPVWVTRDGREAPIGRGMEGLRRVRLSPDGERLALRIGQTIHVMDLPDGPPVRVTRDGALNYRFSWSPGSTHIYYSSDRRASDPPQVEVFRVSADGVGEPEAVSVLPTPTPSAILSSDSTYWIYRTRSDVPDGGNLMALSTEVGAEPFELVATDAIEGQPDWSSDGRWFAYSSDVSGVRQVYVQPFPDPVAAPRVQISQGNGHSPAFSPSTDELFYVEDDAMWSARYRAGDDGFTVLDRTRLFDVTGYRLDQSSPYSYGVARDAERFAFTRLSPVSTELVLVLDAMEQLTSREPAPTR